MKVQITSYRVTLATRLVEIVFTVILPTGGVEQTITATEVSLDSAATARGASAWAEADLVQVVASAFRELAGHVSVVEAEPQQGT